MTNRSLAAGKMLTTSQDELDEALEELGKMLSSLRQHFVRFLRMRLPKGAYGCFAIFLIVFLIFAYTFRSFSLFHWLAMRAITQPISTTIDVFSLIAALIWLSTGRRLPKKVTIPVIILDLVLIPIIVAGYQKQYFVNDLPVIAINTLPDTTQVRYLPYEVAQQYGVASMQESTLELGEFHPVDYDLKEISWISAQEPHGIWNKFTGQADGFKLIHPDRTIEVFHEKFKYGEGMWITDDIRWQLYNKHYFAELGEIYYMEYEGHVLAIAPYVSYYFKFPFSLPKWGGVFIVHADGSIEDLSPEEAQADPRLTAQRLYPRSLVRKMGEAWAWHLGPVNFLFKHVDQTEIPDAQQGTHKYPYLIPTEQGPKWFLPLDPKGPGKGISKILLVDAFTGAIHLHELGTGTNLLGPSVAKDYLRLALPDYNFILPGKGSQGNFYALEPRPVVVTRESKSILYWMFSVTTKDYSGINLTGLVNADPSDSHVLIFTTLDEINAFLTQGILPDSEVQVFDPSQMTAEEIEQTMQDLIDELIKRSN